MKVITVQIGTSKKDISEANESWIIQQINRRRKDGQEVCVEVRIRTDSLDFTLATPNCGGSHGRRPQPNEQEIFDLWKKHGLNESEFKGGNLVAFVKQLRKMLG